MSALPHREIHLSAEHVALIDEVDWPLVSAYRWRVRVDRKKWIYAQGIGARWVVMHRLIMQPAPGQMVDHWNHNGLDNRRANLRICTRSQNNGNQRLGTRNTSGFKGVSWNKAQGHWFAQIMYDERNHWLGSFSTPEEAAARYDLVAREVWGEFACTNADLGLLPTPPGMPARTARA